MEGDEINLMHEQILLQEFYTFTEKCFQFRNTMRDRLLHQLKQNGGQQCIICLKFRKFSEIEENFRKKIWHVFAHKIGFRRKSSRGSTTIAQI